MKVMILAAGMGLRLRPHTLATAKALIKVGPQGLIEHLLYRLGQAGLKDIVINTYYHGRQIHEKLRDGHRYDVNITYSHEFPDPLETGGGIFKALPLLGSEPFLVISSDIFTDFPWERLPKQIDGLAHLILAPKPGYLTQGDFNLEDPLVTRGINRPYTFANISILHPSLFEHCQPGFFKLSPILFQAIARQQVTGSLYTGSWINVGTPETLAMANAAFSQSVMTG